MLTANGCSYKRVVIKGEHKKTFNRILYDCEGEEVALTEPCDAFTGCWELEDETTGTTYRAHVMTESDYN